MEKLTLKDNWSEINIAEWIEIGKVGEMPELQELNIATRIKVAAIVSNYSEAEIEELSGALWGRVYVAVDFVSKNPPKKRKKKSDQHRIIILNETEYIFHPNPQDMNAGEQASIETLMVDHKNGGEVPTHKILAILIRPLIRVRNEEFDRDDFTIEKFDTANMDERAEMFLTELTVDEIWHEWAFFLNLGKRSIKHSLQSTPPNRKQKRANNRQKSK